MKKVISLLLVLCMVMAATSGCSSWFGQGGDSTPKPSNSAAPTTKPTETPKTTPAGKTTGMTPSESYEKYTTAKGLAYEAIGDAIGNLDGMDAMYAFALLPLAFIDLGLIPLALISLEADSESLMALSMLGMAGVKWDKDGDMYTLSFTDEEGVESKMTCEYDPVTDSMRSTTITGGVETMLFEYTSAGGGYASQYFMMDNADDEDSECTFIKCYFDASGFMAFNMGTAEKKPESIYKKTNLTSDFAEGDGTYMAIKDGALTIIENGVVKVQ